MDYIIRFVYQVPVFPTPTLLAFGTAAFLVVLSVDILFVILVGRRHRRDGRQHTLPP
jgi:hypothetical protein